MAISTIFNSNSLPLPSNDDRFETQFTGKMHHSPHLTCQILSHRKNFSYRFKTLPTQNFGSAHVYTHIGTGRQANIYRLGATTVIQDMPTFIEVRQV